MPFDNLVKNIFFLLVSEILFSLFCTRNRGRGAPHDFGPPRGPPPGHGPPRFRGRGYGPRGPPFRGPPPPHFGGPRGPRFRGPPPFDPNWGPMPPPGMHPHPHMMGPPPPGMVSFEHENF